MWDCSTASSRSGPAGLADVDRLSWFFDEPFGDPSALPFFTLCEAAAGHATVFLSGDGGDETFAGYRRYIEAVNRAGVIRAAGRVGGTLRTASRLLPQGSLARFRLSKLALPDHGCAAAFDEMPTIRWTASFIRTSGPACELRAGRCGRDGKEVAVPA
jgi:asparagine synthetase B (glutamine-hydrolysing)